MQLNTRYFFYDPGGCATMLQSLRRTLVRFVRCSSFLPQRCKGAKLRNAFVFLCVFTSLWLNLLHAQNTRQDISLDKSWHSIADDKNKETYNGFQKTPFNDKQWQVVNVPHNWDAYEGYRRLRHGNRHGYAWYRKSFELKHKQPNKRYFLFFEGVGSYATVWLNEKQVGYHAGGRTTFTIDVTNAIHAGKPNILAVRADHPSFIKDLPWLCGGCSDDRGWSEGSQPMGIFRPVHLLITNEVRVEPFGVHVWNDTTVSTKSAQLYITSEIKNYSSLPKTITVFNKLVEKNGSTVFASKSIKQVAANTIENVHHTPPVIANPHLWSLEDPYLYNVVTEVWEDKKLLDRTVTPYGIRWISWPIAKPKSSNQFLLNGKPVFLNGIAEYEHLVGKSHAFSAEQIRTRVMQIKSAGFNAFRDAHQPHNLRYQNYWDSLGILWWTQLSAHAWYDSPEFRSNFKALLKEWVKERRNSPSVVLWGLQNESKLPEDFANECTGLIRQLDPTASSQRLVTTCNGGAGTDWDVPQNWTGTYGGNPATYSDDVKRQILIGEYGAWRTLDLHSERAFNQNGVYSEDRMTQLMEMKVKLAEAAKDSTAGHFMWLLTSHDNPGRVQAGEGFRELDRIGPVNYKGLLTPWEEPLDVFYMYRANYASKQKEPMVYIVSHTWPNRWTTTGRKDSIIVYSNCDEVELFNDVRSKSLGKRKRNGVGTHFQWDKADINYNVLYAVGYVDGKEVASDYIVMNNLPQSPNFNLFYKDATPVTKPQPNHNYLYRINCGGPEYKDKHGNTWLADRAIDNEASLVNAQSSNVNGEKSNSKPETQNPKSKNSLSTASWGSTSWTADFPGMPANFANQRKTNDPIHGTEDWKLFQTFRYGREKLKYQFAVPDGEYLVELYFIEPWFGAGGGMDCTGWRLFDVAINEKTVLKNVDIWQEVGHDAALKKTVKANIRGGTLTISFPNIASGQAVISAIAIATLHKNIQPAPSPKSIIQHLEISSMSGWSIQQWADVGDEPYAYKKTTFNSLPPELFGAEWIKTSFSCAKLPGSSKMQFNVSRDADLFVAIPNQKTSPIWLAGFSDTKTTVVNSGEKIFAVYKKKFAKGDTVQLAAGEYNGEMYTVFVLPATTMEPAYDLKPVTGYKAAKAQMFGTVLSGMVDGKVCAIFGKASAENAVEWSVSVGVADIYSLTISYNNPGNQIIKSRLQLMAADGTLMKEDAVEFTPTRAGKSNYISTTTGTMINAGNYRVRLAATDAEGVSVNSLDIQ